MKPTKADREAAKEIIQPPINPEHLKGAAVIHMSLEQNRELVTDIIARHMAPERERAERIEKVLSACLEYITDNPEIGVNWPDQITDAMKVVLAAAEEMDQ